MIDQLVTFFFFFCFVLFFLSTFAGKLFPQKFKDKLIGLFFISVSFLMFNQVVLKSVDRYLINNNVINLISVLFSGIFSLLFFFIGIGLIFQRFVNSLNRFTKDYECKICHKKTKDSLSIEGKEEGKYCRVHLVEKFKQHFKSSSFNMVIVEFEPEAEDSAGNVYGYYPVSELIKFDWGKEDVETIKFLLDQIKLHKCKKDERKAKILFISKESMTWENYESLPLREFASKGEFLCNEHALDKIVPSIISNPKSFLDGGGLYMPYKEDGYYTTTLL